MIPYGRQDINEADVQAVTTALLSDYITQGPAILAFEQAIMHHCNSRHGVAVSSATAGLHLAYAALGLGPGDLLWTSPITFVATSNAALYCGAEVDFVDIDNSTYNMCMDALEEKLIVADRSGTLPKIVVPVHFAGQSCDMERLAKLRDRFGFRVVEDASHAIGGSYRGSPVGNCAYSDICVFSFHPVKIITTAEGGMATTNSAELADRILTLRTHGITRDSSRMVNVVEGPWYYEQQHLGFNYRMTDLQAALGVSQVSRLSSFIADRHEKKKIYDDELSNLPLLLPFQSEDQHSALHLYPVLLTDDTLLTRREVFDAMRGRGVGVNVHYIPVYRQPYYADIGFSEMCLPNAENYYSRTLSIPMYAHLREADQYAVISSLKEIFA